MVDTVILNSEYAGPMVEHFRLFKKERNAK